MTTDDHIAVTDQVILVDARGCWRRHTVRAEDTIDGDGLRLAESTWRRSRFVWREWAVDGCAILRSAEPAIGPLPGRPGAAALYVPEGWYPPSRPGYPDHPLDPPVKELPDVA